MFKALITATIRRARVCELVNTTVVLNNISAAAKSLPAHQYRPNILFRQLVIPSYEISDRIDAENISIAGTTNPQSKVFPDDKYAAEVLYMNLSEFQCFRQPTLVRDDVEDRGSSRFQNSTPGCGIPALRPPLWVGYFLGYSRSA